MLEVAVVRLEGCEVFLRRLQLCLLQDVVHAAAAVDGPAPAAAPQRTCFSPAPRGIARSQRAKGGARGAKARRVCAYPPTVAGE